MKTLFLTLAIIVLTHAMFEAEKPIISKTTLTDA
jgi:hypothetical protein